MAKKKPEEGKPEEPYNVKLDLYFWLQALVMALVGIILVFTIFGRLTPVDGTSMLPTLHDKDMMVVRSLGYTPAQGDVIVLTKYFVKPDGTEVPDPIVKRVIAVGGQTVDIDYDAGTVAVDGQVLDEPYIHEAMLCPTYENQTHIEVPEGSIFVMGDNRNHSSDSRDVTLGTVDTRYLLGKAEFICFPFSDFGRIG